MGVCPINLRRFSIMFCSSHSGNKMWLLIPISHSKCTIQLAHFASTDLSTTSEPPLFLRREIPRSWSSDLELTLVARISS